MSLGLGVMLRMLSGHERVDMSVLVGKRLASVAIVRDDERKSVLTVTFEDGTVLRLADEGQSCCESRYMTCDDDLSYLAGAEFVNAEIVDVKERQLDDGESHDLSFLKLVTSKATATVVSHNEHNGYYGGFSIEASIEQPEG